jgi:trk system potassium uptake protein TrkH
MRGLHESLLNAWFRASPAALLAGSFAALILLGTILLSLPQAHAAGAVGGLDALFTATSAVCVTGLIVVDTAGDFTRFGQAVILCLIQLGGLGIMTFAALFLQMLGRRMSLRTQGLVHDTLLQRDLAAGFPRLLRRILLLTFALEAAGAGLLFLGFLRELPATAAAWHALFHSVSAFCNAGFSTFRTSLVTWRANGPVMTGVAGLILAGGAGHLVLVEGAERWLLPLLPWRRVPRRKLGFHSRVVLTVSAALLLSGWAGLMLFGTGPGTGEGAERWSAAFFQSVTARTAGFNTVEIGALPVASLLLLACLMLIGGSPASCAGGVKTTTFAAALAWLWAGLRGSQEVRLFGRRLPESVLGRAGVILGLALGWNLLGVFVLLATEGTGPGRGLAELLFEQVSAFGTVGLSTGLTPSLSTAGRIWIILTMYVGRLGPLTLAAWAVRGPARRHRLPEGRVMVG